MHNLTADASDSAHSERPVSPRKKERLQRLEIHRTVRWNWRRSHRHVATRSAVRFRVGVRPRCRRNLRAPLRNPDRRRYNTNRIDRHPRARHPFRWISLPAIFNERETGGVQRSAGPTDLRGRPYRPAPSSETNSSRERHWAPVT